MIRRLAAVTAKWLLQAGAIFASDVELYKYGIYSFLFTLCPLGLALVISFFLNMVVEGPPVNNSLPPCEKVLRGLPLSIAGTLRDPLGGASVSMRVYKRPPWFGQQ